MIDKKYATHDREPFFELARPYIETNSKVLDIGAGHGSFAKHFNRDDFYLFDGNPETISFLKNNYDSVKEGKLPILPYEDSYFDVIHCSHVIEHLEADILFQTLVEMNRCLKIGGTIIISTPLMWEGFYNDLSHVRPYPANVLKNYLCFKDKQNRTRIGIKDKYKVVKNVNRFKEKDLSGELFFSAPKILAYFISGFLKIFNRVGIKFYNKTGYTIVLKKL